MMMSTGSNTLRGGVRAYLPHTLTGNWAEDRLAPAADAGATAQVARSKVETEVQARNVEATGVRDGPYASFLRTHARIQTRSGAKDGDAAGSASWLHGSPLPNLGSSTMRALESEVGAATATLAASSAPGRTHTHTARRTTAPVHFDSIEDRFDFENVINPDRLYPASTWASVTASTHFGAAGGSILDRDEFKSTYTLGGGGIVRDPSGLAAYRRRWTHDATVGDAADAGNAGQERGQASGEGHVDAEAVRGALASSLRFTTDHTTTLGAHASERHHAATVRSLAGTVKCVSVCAQKATSAHGSTGVLFIARLMPGRANLPQLRKALATAGVHLSVDEGKELWREMDPEDVGEAEGRRLVGLLLAQGVRGVRLNAVRLAWSMLQQLGRGTVTLGAILALFDPGNHLHPHPDVRARIHTPSQATQMLKEAFEFVIAGEPAAPPVMVLQRETAAAAAAAAAETIEEAIGHGAHIHRVPAISDPAAAPVTWEQFRRTMHYVSASLEYDSAFCTLVAGGWHLEDAAYVLGSSDASSIQAVLKCADITPLPVRSVAVLATRADGTKCVLKVPHDRFLQETDTTSLLERLHAQGEKDVVAVSRNF